MSNFYGLIGEKLGHSLSPKIHGYIFKKLNIDATYSLLEIKKEDLADAVRGLKALGCRGVNVTIPYKIEIMKYLDKISKEAAKIGAVNTIAFCDDGLTGYNTDYFGFGCTLKRASINIAGKKAAILGTGGASKAVYQYLLDNNIEQVVFVSRNPESAYSDTGKIITYLELEGLGNMDIIINCTPCGMFPVINAEPVSKELLCKFSVAVDLIYNPVETLFLKNARESGLVTANGLFMLTAQAAASQEIWQHIELTDEFLEELYTSIKEGIH